LGERDSRHGIQSDDRTSQPPYNPLISKAKFSRSVGPANAGAFLKAEPEYEPLPSYPAIPYAGPGHRQWHGKSRIVDADLGEEKTGR
jgi:hypothetical protein